MKQTHRRGEYSDNQGLKLVYSLHEVHFWQIFSHFEFWPQKNNLKIQLISWKFLRKYKLYQMLSISYLTVMIVNKVIVIRMPSLIPRAVPCLNHNTSLRSNYTIQGHRGPPSRHALKNKAERKSMYWEVIFSFTETKSLAIVCGYNIRAERGIRATKSHLCWFRSGNPPVGRVINSTFDLKAY